MADGLYDLGEAHPLYSHARRVIIASVSGYILD